MRFGERSIDELLDAFPRLRRAPGRREAVSVVVGKLEFRLQPDSRMCLEDAYDVRMEIATDGRDELPAVFETAGRIPRHLDHHVSPVSGGFCLGSPLALRLRLGRAPTLLRFVEQCVVPFLYAATWRRLGQPGWPFQELDHGVPGLVDDYGRLLKLRNAAQIGSALVALGARPRVANRQDCPCGCGTRLGHCDYRWHLAGLRASASRRYYRQLAREWLVQSATRIV